MLKSKRTVQRIVLLMILVIAIVILSKTLLHASAAIHAPSVNEGIQHLRQENVLINEVKKAQKRGEKWWEYLAEEYILKTHMTRGTGAFAAKELFWLFYSKEKKNAYHKVYAQIWKDATVFPVPYVESIGTEEKENRNISFQSSFLSKRSYGGERLHEGCDIMAGEAEAGFYPVVSMTDGVVEKKGWLNLGGYRVGIRTPEGAYFYYAHFQRYEEGVDVGKKVKAGDVIGYMGDSGYGAEGTTGRFPVHLHIGIYVKIHKKEVSVNPYSLLKYLESSRKSFYQPDNV